MKHVSFLFLCLFLGASSAEAAKILKNTTASPVAIPDVGQTVPASGQLTISPSDYTTYAGSSNTITFVGSGTLVVNDGSSDLSIADGTNLIQGIFPSAVGVKDGSSATVATVKPPSTAATMSDKALVVAISPSSPITVTTGLPAGAATSANQSTEIGYLSSIDGKTPALVSGRQPVDGSGVIQPMSAASLPLPTGAATSANQSTANTTLSSISGQLPSTLGPHTTATSLAINVASDQVVPISASALPLPSGASTSANQTTGNSTLATISGQLPATLGPKTMANSESMTIASDQSPVPVSGTFWQATQPVSAAALPLPTGASTSANQTTANTSLSSIDIKLPSLVSGRVPVDASGVPVPVTGTFWQATQPVSAASLPLPTGASTAAKQDTLDTDLKAAQPRNMNDGAGNLLTSQVSGSFRPLDVEVLVGGTVKDPTQIRSLATGTDSVTVGSSVLPTGAATSANQTTANTSLASMDGKLTTTANGLKVDVQASALPTGAATAANQSTEITNLGTIDTDIKASQPRKMQDGSGTGLTSTLVNARQALDIHQADTNFIVSGLSAVGLAPSLNPVSVAGTDGGGLKRHFLTDTTGRMEIDTAQSLPLPTGAATSANQTTEITDLGNISAQLPATIGSKSAANSLGVTLSGESVTGNLGSLNSTLTVTTIGSQSLFVYIQASWVGDIAFEISPDGSSWFGATTTAAALNGGLISDTTANGTFYVLTAGAKQARVRMASYTSGTAGVVLSTSAAPSFVFAYQPQVANFYATVAQTGNWVMRLQDGSGSAVNKGQTTMSGSLPVAVASDNGLATSANQTTLDTDLKASQPRKMQDGAGTNLTSTLSNINSHQGLDGNVVGDAPAVITATASALNQDIFASIDVSNYKAIAIQATTGAFSGTITFQGSNDNFTTTNTVFCSQTNSISANPQSTIVNTAGAGLYLCPVTSKQFRARITAFTSGSMTGTSQLMAFSPADMQQRSVSVQGAVTTTLAAGTLASQAVTTDIASSARTTTFTSASINPANGSFAASYAISVTVVSGTLPTMDCVLQESNDTGTTFYDVYHWERITATGVYQTESIRHIGNRIKYVCTIAGTTPSFTFSGIRIDAQHSAAIIRRFFDRAISGVTPGSTTASWYTEGCESYQFYTDFSSCSAQPVITLDLSEDNTNFAATALTLTPAANGIAISAQTSALGKFSRLRTSTAGVLCTDTYVALRCKGH